MTIPDSIPEIQKFISDIALSEHNRGVIEGMHIGMNAMRSGLKASFDKAQTIPNAQDLLAGLAMAVAVLDNCKDALEKEYKPKNTVTETQEKN